MSDPFANAVEVDPFANATEVDPFANAAEVPDAHTPFPESGKENPLPLNGQHSPFPQHEQSAMEWLTKAASPPSADLVSAVPGFDPRSAGGPLTPIGEALGAIQEHIGRPVANAAMHIALHHAANNQSLAGQLTNEGNAEGVNTGAGGGTELPNPQTPVHSESPADAAAAQAVSDRFQGSPLFADPRPTQAQPATWKEHALRTFFSGLGSNQTKLNTDEAKAALQQFGDTTLQTPLGPVNASDVYLKGLDFAGDMPFYLLPTGVGGMAVKGEEAALAAGELLAPKELLAETARIGAKKTAVETGAQGAIVAAKNGEDPQVAFVSNGVFGYVTHKLTDKLFNISKGEILSQANGERKLSSAFAGALLPPQTWEQFVKDAEQTSNRALVKVRKGAATRREAAGSIIAEESTPFNPEQKPMVQRPMVAFDDGEAHTYKTPVYDNNGQLWLKYQQANVDGTVKTVKTEKVDDHFLNKLYQANKLATANKTIPPDFGASRSDPIAFADYLHRTGKILYGPQEDLPGELWGNPDYKAPEEVKSAYSAKEVHSMREYVNAKVRNDAVDPELRKLPTVNLGPRAAEATPRPVVITVDPKSGVLHSGEINDGALDPNVKTPRRGDLVKVPDGHVAVVEFTSPKKGTASLRKLTTNETFTASDSQIAAVGDHEVEGIKLNPAQIRAAYGSLDGIGSSPATKIGPQFLLRAKVLTIPRVRKIMGNVDEAEALSIIRGLVDSNQVEDIGGGKWNVNETNIDNGHSLGSLVYYNTTSDGMGRQAVLRGPDPKNNGNWLLEIGDDKSVIGPRTAAQAAKAAKYGLQPEDIFPKTRTISIPSEQLRTVKPVLWGSAKDSQLPQQLGIQRPIPADIVPVSAAASAQIEHWTKLASDAAKASPLTTKLKDAWNALINNHMYQIPVDLRPYAQQLAAAPGLMKAQTNAGTEFLGKMYKGILSSDDAAISNLIKMQAATTGNRPSPRDVAIAQYFQTRPQFDAEVHATTQKAVDRLKDNQKFFASRGVSNIETLEQSRALGLQDEYVVNDYMKYMTARDDYAAFARKNMPDVWDKALRTVMRPGENAWQAESRMMDLLDTGLNAKLEAQAKKSPNGDVSKNLKKRVQMQNEIAAILGKTESGAVQLAHSLAATDSLRMRINTWDNIANTDYWSPGPRPDLGPSGGIQVPDSPIYGAAAGGRVHESMAPLINHEELKSSAFGLARTIGSIWKFNVVIAGGAAPWSNNIMRNWKGGLLSGGIVRPDHFLTFFRAAQLMREYSSNPIIHGPAQEFVEAMTNGAVSTGLAANEISQNKVANRVFDAVRNANGKAKDPMELMQELSTSIKGNAAEVGHAYDTIDRLFKFTSYLNLKRDFLAQGMHPNDAAAMATMRINDSFPNYEQVSPIVEKLRKGALGAIAPFLSSKAEDIRINAGMVARLAKEPHLGARLLQASAVFGGAYMFLREMRRANGITDDMAEKAYNAPKLSSQAYRPGRIVAPWLDSQKRIQILDTTPWEDALMSLRYNPIDNPIAGILQANMNDIFGQDTMPGRAADSALVTAMNGNLHPMMANNPSWKPGEGGVTTFLANLAQGGALPQAPFRAYDIFKQGGDFVNPKKEAGHEQWTKGQQAAKLLGAPFAYPVGEKTDVGRAQEFGQSMNQLGQQMGPAVLNHLDDASAQEEIIKAKLDSMDSLTKDFAKSQGEK